MNTQNISPLWEAAAAQKRPQTLGAALALYERIYMPSRNFAEKTRLNYHHDLAALIAFLHTLGHRRLDRIALGDLEAYFAELDRRGLAGLPRRRKTYACKSFFSFLYRSGYILQNPSERLIPPKAEQKEPRVLTKQECEALLRACSHHPRDSAIIEILLQTGVRLSEAARLTIHDVDLPARVGRDPNMVGRAHILGKGRKERWIPLNYKACRAVKTWLDARPQVAPSALFISKFGQGMGLRAIQHLVKKYLDEAGIVGACVHTLRHTFATHHVAQGTSLRTVQEVLGHASLKTTSIYVQLAQEGVKRELQEHAL
jgi:site-specific recombinase XerD